MAVAVRCVFTLCLLVLSQLLQAAPLIRLTSLEWPPYTGQSLPQQGATSAIVMQAFAAAGYDFEPAFYPWTRAVNLARDHADEYPGYFPEYLTEATAARCVLSEPVGSSPLGFVEPVDKPVLWQTLDDLAGLNIGVVQDYVNTTEFDERVGRGDLTTTRVIRDSNSIRMVAGRRLDLAVIDRNVFRFLLSSQGMRQISNKVRFNNRLLENKLLYVCFSPGQEALRDAFNTGLKTLQPDVLQREYLEQNLHQ